MLSLSSNNCWLLFKVEDSRQCSQQQHLHGSLQHSPEGRPFGCGVPLNWKKIQLIPLHLLTHSLAGNSLVGPSSSYLSGCYGIARHREVKVPNGIHNQTLSEWKMLHLTHSVVLTDGAGERNYTAVV